MIEACAQHFITDPLSQFDYLECIENNDDLDEYEKFTKKCVASLGLDGDIAA